MRPSHPVRDKSVQRSTGSSAKIGLIIFSIVLLSSILLFLALSIYESFRVSSEVQAQLDTTEPARLSLDTCKLKYSKDLEEIVKLRLENSRQRLVFSGFLTQLVAIITVIITIAGLWQASIQYLFTRRKEREDNLANAFSSLVQGLAGNSIDEQAVCMTGLQRFLMPDQMEYHERTVALINLFGRVPMFLDDGRSSGEEDRLITLRTGAIALLSSVYKLPGDKQDYLKNEIENLLHQLQKDKIIAKNVDNSSDKSGMVKDTEHLKSALESQNRISIALAPVMEYAFKNISSDILRKYSWQGLYLNKADLANIDLSDLDFSNSKLINCNLSGSNLTKTQMVRADLSGSVLENANLSGADLTNSNLTNVSLNGADLSETTLIKIKILKTDITGCDFNDVIVDWGRIDWKLTIGWEKAVIPPSILEEIQKDLGLKKEQNALHCLMLLWELPPFVTGGGWTASYHMIRYLMQQGVKVTVASPWMVTKQTSFALGLGIEVIPLNILDFNEEDEEDIISRLWFDIQYPGSVYTFQQNETKNNDNGTHSAYGAYALSFGLMDRYTQRILEHYQEIKRKSGMLPDIIHANDWVTFPAAAALAQLIERPWISQFHSTEAERTGLSSHPMITHIEQEAAKQASMVFAVSNCTAAVVARQSGVPLSKINVIPNIIVSRSHMPFRPARWHADLKQPVIGYVGRFSWQKGPDRFISVAREVGRRIPEATFALVGRGPDYRSLKQQIIESPITWSGHVNAGQTKKSTYTDNSFLVEARPAKIDTDTWLPVAVSGKLTDKSIVERKLITNGFKFTIYDTDIVINNDRYKTLISVFDRHTSEDELYLTKWTPDSGDSHKNDFDREQWKNRFHFTGFVDWFKREIVYSNLTILLVPSRYEPFGMVVLEAMECGVPVICENTAGVNEKIKSIVAVDFEDEREVANRVMRLLLDPQVYLNHVYNQYNELQAYINGPDRYTLLTQYNELAASFKTDNI